MTLQSSGWPGASSRPTGSIRSRAVVRRVRDRVRNKFNVAAAEVDDLDDPAVAALVFVAVSNAETRSHATAQRIQRFIERLAIDAEVAHIETETLHL